MKFLSRLLKIIAVVLGGLAGVLLILLIALQLLLYPKTLTPLLEKAAQKFVLAPVSIGSADLDLLKSFPSVTLSLDDIVLSYSDSVRQKNDTLVSLKHLFADVDCLSLASGEIKVNMLALDSLYAYAFRRDSSFSNWDVLPQRKGKDSTGKSSLPHIVLDSLRIREPDLTLVDSLNNSYAKLRFSQFYASGEVLGEADSLKMNMQAALEGLDLGALEATLGPKLLCFSDDLSTDAVVNIFAKAEGCYHAASATIPHCQVRIEVPDSRIEYADLLCDSQFDATIDATITPSWMLNIDIPDFCLDFDGFGFNANGSVIDLLGDDPAFELDAKLDAALCKLSALLTDNPDSLSAQGNIALKLAGKGYLSDLSVCDFVNADLSVRIDGHGVKVFLPSSQTDAYMDGTRILIDTYKTANASRGLYASVDSDSLSFISGSSFVARARKLHLDAQGESIVFDTALFIPPLKGKLSADSFILKGADSLLLGILNTQNDFSYSSRKSESGPLSDITFDSSNEQLLFSNSSIRTKLSAADISLQGHMMPEPSVQNISRGEPVMPFFSKDSLMKFLSRDAAKANIPEREFVQMGMGPIFDGPRSPIGIPDFLSEADFRAKDIKFSLSESLTDFVRRWNPSGSMKIGTSSLVTPLLPLRNWVERVEVGFDKDKIQIDTIALTAGTSSLYASGSVSGISDMVDQRGPLRVNLNLSSTTLDANQLLDALKSSSSARIDCTDEENLSEAGSIVMEENKGDTLGRQLLVVPANLIANMHLDFKGITYSDIYADYLRSDIVMRERCLQLADTEISTDLGYLELDAFYSTKTKKDISAGFDLLIKDATAEDLIELIPSLDTTLTALKSFKGKLNTEMAGTAMLDTNMKFILPSIDGVFQIKGSNLGLSDTGNLKKIAKLLLFKNSESSFIDNLSINGVVTENKLQVFPFILDIDRYRLALNGFQDFSNSFKYNISLLRSPLPLKLGVDVYGQSFKDMNFRVGRAHFRDGNVPAFTEQLNALQSNLVSSIKNIFNRGAASVVNANSLSSRELEMKRRRMVESDMSELSVDEQLKMDELSFDYELEQNLQEEESEIYSAIDEAFKNTFNNYKY